MHSSRGRYSNNRGGRGRGYGSTVQRGGMELPEKALPFGTVISTLTHEEVKTSLSSGRATSITGCQYLASFNWLKKGSPTIVVPGKYRITRPDVGHEADEQRLTSEVDTTQTASSTGRRFRRLLPRYQRRTIPEASNRACRSRSSVTESRFHSRRN